MMMGTRTAAGCVSRVDRRELPPFSQQVACRACQATADPNENEVATLLATLRHWSASPPSKLDTGAGRPHRQLRRLVGIRYPHRRWPDVTDPRTQRNPSWVAVNTGLEVPILRPGR